MLLTLVGVLVVVAGFAARVNPLLVVAAAAMRRPGAIPSCGRMGRWKR